MKKHKKPDTTPGGLRHQGGDIPLKYVIVWNHLRILSH